MKKRSRSLLTLTTAALAAVAGTAMGQEPELTYSVSLQYASGDYTPSETTNSLGRKGGGSGKDVVVLLDQSHLKLATIALRQGTALPLHSAPVPATILVLEGEGVMHIGGKLVPVSKGTLVSLAAGEEHDVVPEAESDMLLLVHYLRGAKGRTSP